ncbi:MAG: hypothetical protein ACPGXK_08450 [Phycisphaerae bacterium]
MSLKTKLMSIALAPVLVGIVGCASKEEEVVWTPRPKVPWEDVIVDHTVAPKQGFELHVNGPTQGLFPARISVVRLARSEDCMKSEVRDAELFRDPRNEFLQWNSAFDDQMAVSEVFPIARRDLGGGPAMPPQILAAMSALGGEIGLIYAVNELAENETEMLGALYDTSSMKQLASMRAVAESVIFEEDEEPEDEDINLFETDSKALVRDEFERLVYLALRELIMNDEPAKVEAPEGWIPDRPMVPAQWPPLVPYRTR